MPESNPILHQSREDVREGATSEPVARPLDLHPGHHFPSPRPRLALPHREVWGFKCRHHTEGVPCRHRTEATEDEHKVEYLVAKYEAERAS